MSGPRYDPVVDDPVLSGHVITCFLPLLETRRVSGFGSARWGLVRGFAAAAQRRGRRKRFVLSGMLHRPKTSASRSRSLDRRSRQNPSTPPCTDGAARRLRSLFAQRVVKTRPTIPATAPTPRMNHHHQSAVPLVRKLIAKPTATVETTVSVAGVHTRASTDLADICNTLVTDHTVRTAPRFRAIRGRAATRQPRR
jgi:hypothetical protein